MKKAQNHLIIEKAQFCASVGEVEQAIDEACQHIFDNTTELTAVSKAKRLGETIVKLQDTNLLLNALVHPETPPEQVAEHKNSIEEIVADFETMEQEAKTIMEAMTQFWKSIVQDEKIDQLNMQVQEVEGQLTTLKIAL